MRSIISLLFVFVATFANAQDGNAPFGLKWGMSSQDAEAQGIKLGSTTAAQSGQATTATGLSKVLSDTESVSLYFGDDNKLWRVASVSTTFRNDGHGAAAMRRFEELSKLLSDRYGTGQSLSFVSNSSFFAKSENFAYGLYKNERIVATNWATSASLIQLSVRAASMEDLYYLLIYENKVLAKAQKDVKSKQEKDAL